MNILDATISHILTQLTYRWFPYQSLIELSESAVLSKFSIKEWHQYLSYYLARGDKPWAKIIHSKLDGNLDIVLNEVSAIKQLELPFRYLSICDPCYPEQLRRIAQPPYGLFVRGDDSLFDRPIIAIIGARKSSIHAKKIARSMAKRLAEMGATIVSGGAIGCDAAAHYGALDCDLEPCPSIAVMAGAIDKLYPRHNHQLFDQLICRDALIISERLLGTKPRPYDFPIRNRLIAGLSSRIVLAQAARKSGAMHTVNMGLAEGRDVVVYDNGSNDIRFEGNQSLLNDGAQGFKYVAEFFDG